MNYSWCLLLKSNPASISHLYIMVELWQLITSRDAYTEWEPKHLPTLNMNRITRGGVAVWLSQNRRVFNELNKHRLGLTLRHRGFGQLNRDMSLSNRAGKLQNGHLKRRERETYDADNSNKRNPPWEDFLQTQSFPWWIIRWSFSPLVDSWFSFCNVRKYWKLPIALSQSHISKFVSKQRNKEHQQISRINRTF